MPANPIASNNNKAPTSVGAFLYPNLSMSMFSAFTPPTSYRRGVMTIHDADMVGFAKSVRRRGGASW